MPCRVSRRKTCRLRGGLGAGGSDHEEEDLEREAKLQAVPRVCDECDERRRAKIGVHRAAELIHKAGVGRSIHKKRRVGVSRQGAA